MMMNERIQKLAKQAGFYPALTWDHTEWHAAGHSSLFEKFAELIVRECANIADEPTSQPFDSYGKKIKKHFGIE